MVARVLPVTTGAAIIEKKLSAQNVVRLERLSRPAVRARGDRSACSGAAVHEVAKLRATPGDRREAQAETVLRLAVPLFCTWLVPMPVSRGVDDRSTTACWM
jgi:hypothetical protein